MKLISLAVIVCLSAFIIPSTAISGDDCLTLVSLPTPIVPIVLSYLLCQPDTELLSQLKLRCDYFSPLNAVKFSGDIGNVLLNSVYILNSTQFCVDAAFLDQPNPLPPKTIQQYSQSVIGSQTSPIKSPIPLSTDTQMLVISDAHIYQYYTPGSSSQSNYYEQGCMPGTSGSAGKFGDPNCSSPPAVLEALLQNAHEKYPNIKHVVYVGDQVNGLYEITEANNITSDTSLIISMTKRLIPGAAIHFTIGNHDVAPIANIKAVDGGLITLSSALDDTLNLAQRTTFLVGGYYTFGINLMTEGIVLNSQFWSVTNVYSATNDTNMGNQLNWLGSVLSNLKLFGRKASIFAHIPLNYDWQEVSAQAVLSKLIQYSDVINGIFFGHLHMGGMFTIRSDDTPKILAINLMSATHNGGGDPAYHLVRIGSMGKLVDIHVHTMDMITSNQQGTPVVNDWFSYRDYYNMNALTANDFAFFLNQAVSKYYQGDPSLINRVARAFLARGDSSSIDDYSVARSMCYSYSYTPFMMKKCSMEIYPPTVATPLLKTAAVQRPTLTSLLGNPDFFNLLENFKQLIITP